MSFLVIVTKDSLGLQFLSSSIINSKGRQLGNKNIQSSFCSLIPSLAHLNSLALILSSTNLTSYNLKFVWFWVINQLINPLLIV